MQTQKQAGPPLPRVVQWFKTMSTNAYLRGIAQSTWPPIAGRLWQRNYFERIIRSNTDLERLRDYITANPAH
jgi:REP element-mobilizing transposase RayT